MKRFLIVLLIFCLLSGGVAQYPDVPPGHWAETAVTKLFDLGVVVGYPDGSFQGQRPVSRYELALMLSRYWTALTEKGLSDVWNTILGMQLELDRILTRLEEHEVNLADLADLAERVTDARLRLSNLETQSAAVSERVATLETITQELANEIRALEEGLSREQLNLQEAMFERLESLQAALLEELDKSLAALRGSVDERLAAFKVDVNQQLAAAEQAQQRELNEVRAEVQAQLNEAEVERQAALQAVQAEVAAQESSWQGVLAASAGVVGDQAHYQLHLGLANTMGSILAVAGNEGLEVIGTGRLSTSFEAGGRYQRSAFGSFGGVFMRGYLNPSVGLTVEGGYGQGLELGAMAFHRDGSGAVLPGLTMHTGVRFGSTAKRFDSFLLQADVALAFKGDGWVIEPGVLFRTLSVPGGGYRGLVAQLSGSAAITGALTFAAQVRYGFFDAFGEGVAGRSAPEFQAGVHYRKLSAFVVLESGLPEHGPWLSFNDSRPLARNGYRLGIKAIYRFDLDEEF